MISLNQITKTYFAGTENELHANNNITLSVQEGELVAIIGQSGSGKSTLMNIIGALDKPTSGEYVLDGEKVHEIDDVNLSDIRNRKIGFIFQTFNLLTRMSAIKNVELPLLYAGVSKSARRKRALELLEMVGLKERAHHYPNELSGGQKQRIAIARALANNPSIILADEPTGALDTKTTKVVLDMLLKIHRENGATIVIITHSQEVAAVCDRIVTIVDGKVVSDMDNRAHNTELGLETSTTSYDADYDAQHGVQYDVQNNIQNDIIPNTMFGGGVNGIS
jgi:putative ABC transport system ATP-binding protein